MASAALAVVIGDIDLVRALGLSGIASVFAGASDASARFSRHVQAQLPWDEDPDRFVASLLGFARAQPEPPVLYPQSDASLLLAAHHREELATAFRFSLADTALIDALVDKDRFQALAERHGLPVPAAHRLAIHGQARPPTLDVAFPFVVKPLIRTSDWTVVAKGGKALHVRDPGEWAALWPRLSAWQTDVVVQHLVPGPVTALESYHAYVDGGGAIAGEFTGRKIRTFPALHGYSTAVEVVELPDVLALGRDVLSSLGLRGVAKADFKRDARGRLHLLEVNPRFNLWHHPAAIAGVNLPALVHADLTGEPRPPGTRATRRVTWCTPLTDLRAAHADGISFVRWLRWVRRCDVLSSLGRDDPLPFFRGTLWSAVRRRAPVLRHRA
jgi:D-aspartate ligase